MARRSDHSREELFDLAMAAARGLVERDGFRALTARNVADAIGYSPGTLYNLFENLDDLIVHLNGQTLDELRDHLSSGSHSGNPMTDLKILLDGYLGFLEVHPNLWTVLFDFSPSESQEIPEWYALKVSKVLSLLEDALSPLFGPGEEEERRNAARTLWASLHGICSLSDAGKLRAITTQTVREMAESLVTHFVTGLAVRHADA